MRVGCTAFSLIGCLAAIPIAGCTAVPSREDLPRGEGALPYVVCIVPPKSLSSSTGGGGADRQTLQLDPARVRAALSETFSDLQVCTGVQFLDSSTIDDSESRDVAQEAWSRGSDLLVEAVADRPPSYRFSHRTGWFVPNTLLWFLAGFPSFWIKDRVYRTEWDVTFAFRLLAGGDRLVEVASPLEEARAVSLSDQGWTARALYTPPGFYEGPETPTLLAIGVEEWLAEQLARRVLALRDTLRSSAEVDIEVERPENLTTVAGPRVELEFTVRSPRPLERLRVAVDGERLSDLDPSTMVAPSRRLPLTAATRDVTSGRLEYDITHALRLAPGSHQIRVLALERSDTRPPRLGTEPASWSASRTIRFEVTAGVGSPRDTARRGAVTE